MDPSSLITLGNIRRDYGNLTDLLISINYSGIKVPIAYYPHEGQNVVWDGHRRLRCVQILRRIRTLRTQGVEDSGDILKDLQVNGYLDNAFLDVFAIKELPGTVIEDIPAIELKPPRGSADAIEFQLLCAADGLRAPLNPIEEARAMKELMALGKSPSYIASVLGKSESYVSRRSRLIDLHPDFKKAIESGDLSPRAAEEILTLEDDSDEGLRRSIIGTKTQRRIKAKVAAANAMLHLQQQPTIEPDTKPLGLDPLVLLEREQLKGYIREAIKLLQKIKQLYDGQVSLDELREATRWLERRGDA